MRLGPAYWMLDRRQYVIAVLGFASVCGNVKQCDGSIARQEYTCAHETKRAVAYLMRRGQVGTRASGARIIYTRLCLTY